MGRPSISTERAEKKETNEEVEDPLQKIVDFFVQRIFLLIRAVDRPTIFKNKEKSTPFIRKKNDVGFVLFSFPHENGRFFVGNENKMAADSSQVFQWFRFFSISVSEFPCEYQ